MNKLFLFQIQNKYLVKKMEISETNKNKQQTNFRYLKSFILTWFAVFLLILIFIYLIYLIERYILFLSIYRLMKFLINIFFSSEQISQNTNVFFLAIILSIYLHVKFIQIIIMSFIFLTGGIFSRLFFYDDFIKLIEQQITSIKELKSCLYFSVSRNMLINYKNILLFQKAYNNRKKEENKTFEIKKYEFGEILNSIILLFEKFKEKNYENDDIKNNLIDKLKAYLIALMPYKDFNLIDIFFKFEYNKSKSFLKELFINSFQNRVCNNIIISNDFNAYIVYPEKNGSDLKNLNIIKTLVIFCGQNAFTAEMIAINKSNIQFFLDIKETTIILWNYKGYGARKGFPSFSNIDKDVEELKNYIIKNFSGYKIIIHGISIGGYPAIKLAKSLNEYNDKFKSNVCLIADRTYSDIDLIVESFSDKFGNLLKNIYNFLFPKFLYYSDNIQNYIDVPFENKFIFYSEDDNIIVYNKSSLVYNLTLKYYEEIILPKISKFKEFTKFNNMTQKDFNDIKMNMKRIKNSVNNENFLTLFKNMNKPDKNQFLMFFLIFGYPFNIGKEIFYEKTLFAKNYINIPIIFKNIYEENKINFNTNLFDFFSDLNFLFIKSNLSIPFNDKEIKSFKYNNDKKEFILQDNVNESLLKYFGFVHRIFCEHNESWNNNDKLYLQKFLELKGFINT